MKREEALTKANEASHGENGFDEREMDKIIRQIVDRVRVNYFQNGENRGIPSEVKRIIETNIERI